MTKPDNKTRNYSDARPFDRETDDATYIPPFDLLLKALGTDRLAFSKSRVEVSTDCLKRLIGLLIRDAAVDEAWYLEQNPDVKGAVIRGNVPSAKSHYLGAGYFESRIPRPPAFDPDWYFSAYPDLATVFKRSDTESLRTHFLTRGYFEGRAGNSAALASAERWRTAMLEDK